jgi:hypothetical protein
MRESRSYGSVRGVPGDRRPYRDRYFLRPKDFEKSGRIHFVRRFVIYPSQVFLSVLGV